jgi:hypothetical protein
MNSALETKFNDFKTLVSFLRLNVQEGARPHVVEIIQSEIETCLSEIRQMA